MIRQYAHQPLFKGCGRYHSQFALNASQNRPKPHPCYKKAKMFETASDGVEKNSGSCIKIMTHQGGPAETSRTRMGMRLRCPHFRSR